MEAPVALCIQSVRRDPYLAHAPRVALLVLAENIGAIGPPVGKGLLLLPQDLLLFLFELLNFLLVLQLVLN